MRKILKEFKIRMRWAKVVGYRVAFDRDFLKVFVVRSDKNDESDYARE